MNMQIRVMGGSVTGVSSPVTLDEALQLSGRFGRIIQAEKAKSVATLTTAVGDLSASVINGDDHNGYAHEVANVLLHTLIIAADVGVDMAEVREEMRNIISAGTNSAITNIIQAEMLNRGLDAFSRSNPARI